MSISTIRRSWYSQSISLCLVITFATTMVVTPRASYAGVLGLPQPGTMVSLSSSFVPLMITGLTVHPENPLLIDFIVSTGNSGMSAQQVKKESDRLIKYFLACLTIPENDQWVNLSPYEKQHIVPEDLGQTVLGQDMLAQDYLLKQLTASLIYPEKNLGKDFWDKIYTKANQMYGTTQIPVNTFNKVWILPDTANVFEHKDTVFVVKSHLKVMLDEDYLSLNKHASANPSSVIASEAKQAQVNDLGSQIVRQVVLPAIEQEVNTGKNFAQMRQIYNSMILAVWFKKSLKEALLNQVYTDRGKTNGVNVDDPAIKEKIYRQYLQAYKKGVFNYIKEEVDQNTKEIIPRKYFSGGLVGVPESTLREATESEATAAFSGLPSENEDFVVKGLTEGANGNPAASTVQDIIGSLPEQIDEGEGRSYPNTDSAMATPIQIQRGVAYWDGNTVTTPITRPFRASRQEDVTDITKLPPSEALHEENTAVQSLLQGEGVFVELAAGASSRMNVKDAPSEVRSISQESIQSKAGVPIGVIDGKPVTYLDAFGINVSRLIGQIDQEAVNAGISNNQLNKNDIVLFSNEDYRAEQEGIIAANHNYGLPQQIRFINQPLEPVYWATPADVEKLKSKFKTEADYQAALTKSKDVQARLAAGDKQAVVVQTQHDPLGHGEFLHQLVISGELLRMFDTGKKWFFVRNVDNYAAKLDRVWLQILGRFLNQKDVDFQPEVSPRSPGQSGGSLIVMEDTGSQQLAEDPSLKATVGADGKPMVTPTDSFWFNDAVAIGRPEYVASLYFKPGQTLDQFLNEYRQAVTNNDSEALETIAERGRAKFPKLLDPKLAKNEPGATVKIETNMWQSTGVAPKEMKIESIGVRGARNFNINDYPSMSAQEQQTELANLRFLATKQWTVAPELRAETKAKLTALLGREVTDAEVDLTLESYEGNKRIADDLLRYILKADLVTPGILSTPRTSETDQAMSSTPQWKVKEGSDSGVINGNFRSFKLEGEDKERSIALLLVPSRENNDVNEVRAVIDNVPSSNAYSPDLINFNPENPAEIIKTFGDADLAMTTPVLPRVNPTQTSEWSDLKQEAASKKYDLKDMFAQDPQRADDLRVELNPQFEVDFSKNLIDHDTLQKLIGLADSVGLKGAIEQMFTGEKINETENRAVLHTALRNVKRDAEGNLAAANGPVYVDGKDVMPGVITVLDKMEVFTKKVQSGQWQGASGKKIKNIVNVGIGGSDLGPKMAVEALKPFKAGDIDAYFISNIDGTAAAELMKKLDPQETLVIIASKTFTTQETMQNARTLKDWVLKAYEGTPYQGSSDIIKKHFVAVSTAEKLVTDFGIDKENMFEFWDWVGGRYSMWSAIGLSLATYIGFDNFLQFLDGGLEADDHFRTQPFEHNIPVLKALLNVWYGNFLGAKSEAILPYDQNLGLFPAFAQQFFMESEGKRADRNGQPIDYPTGLVVFGSAGTDAQHSYLQMFHQHPETTIIPADFIGVLRSHNDLPGHHDKLFSNFVAQTEALAFGLSKEEVEKALSGDPKYAALGQDYINWMAEQKTFPGNRPTTSILIDQVTPRTLGNLISTYENQIFAESVIWNIFPNDQWGVELGKKVATEQVLPYLTGEKGLSELGSSGLSPAAQRAIIKYRAPNVKLLAQTIPVAFGTSGHRGIIDKDFNIDLVRRVTQGIAEHLLKTTDLRTIIIGYDTRLHNPEFSKEVANIMAANGFKVLYAQEATPTPVLAILAADRKVAGVINLTASHSPYTDGGIKFSPSHGGAADTETTDSIGKLANLATEYKVTNYEGAVRDGRITELDPQAVVNEYVNGYLIPTLKGTKAQNGVSAWDDIVNYIKNNPEFNLVVDPMQGTGVRTMQVLYGKIAEAAGRPFFKVIHMDNKDPKFTQTGGAPQPAGKYIQGLLDEVKQTPHAMGIAVDGDVDRFGVVDFGGRQFEANEMLGMFAWFLKKDVGLDGSLVKTVATSNFANAVAEHLGMKLIETPVGFKYSVQQVMNGENVLVAGEESAHVATGPFIKSWDDGFAVDLMALWLVAKTGKTLAEYKDQIEKEIGQSFALKVNTVRDEQGVAKASVIALITAAKKEMETKPAAEISLALEGERLSGQKVVDINTMDGVKLVFNSGDSILMRPSGTEPAAKLYVEVSSPERLDAMFKVAEELMKMSDKAQMSNGATEDDDIIKPVTVNRTSLVKPGGIDLNASTLDMQSSGEKVSITFDPAMVAQFRRGDFSGVKIQILDVVPVNLMPLLGLKEG